MKKNESSMTIKFLKELIYAYVKHDHKIFLESVLSGEYDPIEMPMLAYTNRDFIRDFTNLDEKLFRKIYKVLFYKIKISIIKRGGTEADAKDALQQVLLDMIENAKQGKLSLKDITGAKGKSTTADAYIIKACINQYFKSRRHRNNSELDEKIVDNTKEYQHRIDELSSKMLNGSSDLCRQILTSYYFEKKKFPQIAIKLNNTPESVKNQKYRCIEALRLKYDMYKYNL